VRDSALAGDTGTGDPAGDHALAVLLAGRAGEALLTLRQRLSVDGVPAAELKDAGDRASQELLAALLAQHAPGDAVLSEEAKDDPGRLDADRVWIIDPLDGTREFSEPPRTDWAVHVALVAGGRLTAGAVGLPALGEVLATGMDLPVPTARTGPPRILVSRTRPPALAEALASRLGGQLVPMGSAGAKAMAVVRGEGDIYAHGGGQYEWDNAAPVAVAAAAGFHTSRLDGSALRYNRPDPWLPDVLICRPDLAAVVLEVLADLAAAEPLS
jgi:3'(2'), 5'-bisphosphate nucleotidase